MTLDEMKAACARAPQVYLTVKRESLPRGAMVRLTPGSGPLGRVCNVKEAEAFQFDVTAMWASDEVLAWVEKQERVR